jgi:methylthioribose-1-phosphate isomerase
VNLFWAIERMRKLYAGVKDRPVEEIRATLIREAKQVYLEDIAINRAIGAMERTGARRQDGVDACNAGALATAGYGTAWA